MNEKLNLFERIEFQSHSGLPLYWKIECDALTSDEIDTLAFVISKRFNFKSVYGVETGGARLANALQRYCKNDGLILIVDDVLTTGTAISYVAGKLIRKLRLESMANIRGIVLFARGPCPEWVIPMFQLNSVFIYKGSRE